jgi:hypothetical protein
MRVGIFKQFDSESFDITTCPDVDRFAINIYRLIFGFRARFQIISHLLKPFKTISKNPHLVVLLFS